MRPKIEAKILAAALRLFAANGYDRTTIRDIARAAGVPSASIYLKFGSKRDLHKEALYVSSAGPRAPDRSPARPGKHLPHHVESARALIWRMTGEDLVQHGAERINIGALVEFADLSGSLFGRHVSRRAGNRTFHRLGSIAVGHGEIGDGFGLLRR